MSDGPSNAAPQNSGLAANLKQLWARLIQAFGKVPEQFKKYIGDFNTIGKSPVRLILTALGAVLVLFVVYWIFDKLFLYFIARSYVDEIADVFNLNKYLADAIVYLTFVALAFFAGLAIRFSKVKRLIGVFGIIGLMTAHSLVMWWGTSHEIITTKGEALKCYVITHDTVRYGERPGIDPGTGRQCRPVTPELVERLREYEKGNRPRQIVEGEPVFFDLGTGEPIVWYSKNADGKIEIFDLMGFRPDTGEELIPITREVVSDWKLQKAQEAKLPPQPIDPEKNGFFDSVTGKPRVWYRRAENGDYEFYDRDGFHARTGERLSVITSDAIRDWRKHVADAASQKCYVITREAVRYGGRPGIDPVSGKECRLLTPQVLERLREYEKGNRPQRIVSSEPTFFDLRTGEPIVWFYKNKSGGIELFNLMGFHPETGDELLPVTKEVVDLWKDQETKRHVIAARVPPKRIEPDKYAFFDPVTGAPRVWYWRGDKGEYEFYDNPGFQPRTGEQLTIISKEAIGKWKDDLAAAEKLKTAAVIEQNNIDSQPDIGATCDQLAANPRDPKKSPSTVGVPYDLLKYQSKDAIEACTKAVEKYPNELRYQYQLGRALEFVDSKRALEIHLKLGAKQYAAAYDNAGSIFKHQRRYPEAIRQFRLGMQYGDADAFVDLGDMVHEGLAEGNYIALYQQAARLGHEGAQRALDQEQQNQADEQLKVEQNRRALDLMGSVLGGFVRH